MPHLKMALLSFGAVTLALQTWGQVNTALAGTILEGVTAVRPFIGPFLIVLVGWAIQEIRYNTRITEQNGKILRTASKSGTAKPVQGDSVHREDLQVLRGEGTGTEVEKLKDEL